MKWVQIDGKHINAHLVREFSWENGWLDIYYVADMIGHQVQDPEKKYYYKLCQAVGVRPVEEEPS